MLKSSSASSKQSSWGTRGATWWRSLLPWSARRLFAVLCSPQATITDAVGGHVPVLAAGCSSDRRCHAPHHLPPVVRAILPGLIKQMFAPAEVPERFSGLFPKALMLRPSQLRAAAEDAALMTPTVTELEQHYQELTVPVTIITGADDQFADVGRQSARLHQDLPGSEFISLPGLGHMIHHLDPDADTSVVE